MRKRDVEWIVLVFGVLFLAVLVGSLWKTFDLQKGDEAAWRDLFIATTTPEPTFGTTSFRDDSGGTSEFYKWYEFLMAETPTP